MSEASAWTTLYRGNSNLETETAATTCLGAGYIKRLGAKVGSDASPSKALLREGDPVLLSYPFCGECSSCQSGHPAYCLSALALSFGNAGGTYTRPSDATTEAGASVAGGFFGQSSLATLAVVKECCIVNLAGIVQHKEELRLFAPLGCAFQTGGASVSILAGTLPSDSVCIIGLGGVGLAGVMVGHIQRPSPYVCTNFAPPRLLRFLDAKPSLLLIASRINYNLQNHWERPI